MAINPDFRDLYAALNDAGARYLLVGGHAVAFHAQPRFTKDLDIWIDPTPANASSVFKALEVFGAPLGALSVQDLSTEGIIFQIGIPPNRIDILTSIDGVTFDEAWPARFDTTYGDQSIHVIGRDHLRQNKLTTGRVQDLLDADLLK
jgi:hypothetical protein